MKRSFWLRAAALLGAFTLVAAACGDDDDETDAADTTETTAAADDGGDEGGESLLWDNGACDEGLDPYPIGIITTFESPVISLIDQVTALEASVEAFNERGGIGGHCMALTTCDSGADPNKEADCARQFVAEGVVATINDSTAFNPAAVGEVMIPAGLPRIALSPAVGESGAAISYPIGAGSTGTTFMMIPPLARDGITKLAMVHIDSPQIQGVIGVLNPMLAAYGAELVATIPVPAGTTDFQQFTLAAEAAGAEAVFMALGEAEALQVLQAAQQLGTDLRFSASLGNVGLAGMAAFEDLGDQMVFNSELPPVTGSTEIWPILDQVIADLEASGDPKLERDQIKTPAFRSWLGVYALVRIVEDFGDPDTISREAITAALEAATDVDFFGLIPPWTPSSGSGTGPFGSISQPWYYIVEFDTEAEEFVVRPEQLNVLQELAGTIDYEPRPVEG